MHQKAVFGQGSSLTPYSVWCKQIILDTTLVTIFGWWTVITNIISAGVQSTLNLPVGIRFLPAFRIFGLFWNEHQMVFISGVRIAIAIFIPPICAFFLQSF